MAPRHAPHRAAAWLAIALTAGVLPAPALQAQDIPPDEAAWVQRAIAHDAALAAQAEDVGAAAEALRAAGAARWPRVALEWQRGVVRRPDHADTAGPTEPTVQAAGQSTLTLEQTLYDGQRTRLGVAAAQARLAQRRAQRLASLNDRAADTLQALHEWRAAAWAGTAQRAAAQELADLVQAVAQRLRAGVATELDLREAQLRWQLVQADAAQAASRQRAAAQRLHAFTGVWPGDGAPAPAGPLRPTGAPGIDALRERCRAACAGVPEAAQELAATRAERASAQAETRPRVTMDASATRQHNGSGPSVDDRTLRLMLTARWTLFDGGGLSARLAQRLRAELAAEWRLRDRERQALLDFDLALGELDAAVARHRLAAERADTAAQVLRLTQLGFDAGRQTASELADAVSGLARAEAERADADARRRTEDARLRAMVGLLADQAEGPPAPP